MKKLLLIEDDTSSEYGNSINYYKKVSNILKIIENEYDFYIVTRSDCIMNDIIFLENVNNNVVYFSNKETNSYTKETKNKVNNNILVTKNYDLLHIFTEILHYSFMNNNYGDIVLYNFLVDKKIDYQFLNIDFKLVLSKCNIIAISGDSGSGKTTLMHYLNNLYKKNVLKLETDRYHKWERGDENYKTITHLNPKANHLEMMETDMYNLKIGNQIYQVDYDHKTGKFTEKEKIESKKNIILCGLHTLYSKQLRTLSDIKIYVDTSEELKTHWKLQRDTQERGHDTESVLAKIQSRRSDYETHISPQREHADLVIRFHDTSLTLISPHREWLVGLPGEYSQGQVTFQDPTVDLRKQICECVWSLDLPHIEAKPGYDGVIQFTILRALYTKHG
jgi:uridine kinase